MNETGRCSISSCGDGWWSLVRVGDGDTAGEAKSSASPESGLESVARLKAGAPEDDLRGSEYPNSSPGAPISCDGVRRTHDILMKSCSTVAPILSEEVSAIVEHHLIDREEFPIAAIGAVATHWCAVGPIGSTARVSHDHCSYHSEEVRVVL